MQQPNNAQSQQKPADVPEGFELIGARKPVPTVKREALESGAVLNYLRTERFRDKADGDKEYVLHIFSGARGIEFAVWGSAVIDARMSRARLGGVCFIRYDGVVPHPEKKGKTLVQWTVAAAPSSSSPKLSDELTIDEALGETHDDSNDIPF